MNRIFEFIFLIAYCSNLSRSSMFDCTWSLIETRVSKVQYEYRVVLVEKLHKRVVISLGW